MSELIQKRGLEGQSSSASEKLGGAVSLFLRLWTYGGPSQPPSGLPLEQDPEIATLLSGIIEDGKGKLAFREPELLSAEFDDPLQAISTAKALQHGFLSFQRKTEPCQIVPSILIYTAHAEVPPGSAVAAPEEMLANVTSAQILIGAGVYELVKNAPGFKFNPNPVRRAGETFGPQAIYELLWTDDSTYSHLRQASRAGLKTLGRYHIQEEIGRGAMGAVFKAYDELIGRTVALKTISIDRNTPDRDVLIERLQQEAKAAGGLDHPNIITIYDVGQQDDAVFLSMQYVKGITLASLLSDVGVPSLTTFISWADQISAGVGFAHARGVIHRDLKPANLMVTDEGIVKILDFGIAKIENTSLTQTGLVVGTPSYMAPEQIVGKKVDHRADIFALGAVFYELLTSEKAFHGDVTTILYRIVNEDPVAPSLINPAVPGGVDTVIRKALAKDPKDRFQSCEEMRKALVEQAARLKLAVPANAPVTPILTQPPQREEKISPRPRSDASSRKSVWPKMIAALILLTSTWALYRRNQEHRLVSQIKGLVAAARQTVSPGPNNPRLDNSASQQNTGGEQKASGGSDVANAGGASGNAPAPGTPANPELTAPSVAGNPSGTDTPQTPTLTPIPVKMEPVMRNAPGPEDSGTAAAQTLQGKGEQDASAGGSSESEKSADDGKAAGNIPSPDKPSAGTGTESGALRPDRPVTVDGFTLRDVPDLLRQADVAAQRGDYRLARYEYNLVLRLEPKNQKARQGLRLIPSTEPSH